MSIIIRIKDTGEVFDIPSPFALEENNTSPIFNTLGSKTVSADLPKSDNNSRLFGYAHRLDIETKPKSEIPVIVSYGSYSREGVLFLSAGYNRSSSFSVTIAYNEGIMFQKMEDLSLPNLKMPIRHFSDFDNIIAYMNKLFKEDAGNEELTVVCVGLKEEKYNMGIRGKSEEFTWIPYLNEPDKDGMLKIVNKIDIAVNNEQVTISTPKGYGITPFVRVWKILELIFEHFGYTVNSNPFKEHFQLKRLCVLNNVSDAIVWNEIDYSLLMPNVSVMQFLNSLYCRFGLKVFFDGNKNEVSLRLLKDIFSSDRSLKMTPSSLLDIDLSIPKQIKLSAGRNLDKSETETDTFEEFLKKYNNTVSTAYSGNSPMQNGIHYFIKTGLFYHKPIRALEKRISSIHFDWNKKDEGYETEEITSVDECITMMKEESHIPYYAVAQRLVYSDIVISKQNEEGQTEIISSVDVLSGENKLAFIYDMGRYYNSDENGNISYWLFNYGSIFPYEGSGHSSKLQKDIDGNEFIYALTFVGEHGAFNQFHKAYDAFLRHSNRIVKFDINYLPFELSDIDYSQKMIVTNAPVLLDKVNYALGLEKERISATVEARSLHLYTPNNLDIEQLIPIPEPIKYKWQIDNDKEQSIINGVEYYDAIYGAPGYFPENDLPWLNENDYRFKKVSFEEKDDPNPPSDFGLWFLPPTDEQFQAQTKIGFTKHQVKGLVLLHYEQKLDQGWTPESALIGGGFEYNGFFIPIELK